jgi:hypothetical protein
MFDNLSLTVQIEALTVAAKNTRRKTASKQLAKLLGEHLSRFSPAERERMHDKFERRMANTRDSGAKTPSPLRAATR